MDCSPPGSSIHGILQARILAWVAISFSRVSRIAGRRFNLWATREARLQPKAFLKHWGPLTSSHCILTQNFSWNLLQIDLSSFLFGSLRVCSAWQRWSWEVIHSLLLYQALSYWKSNEAGANLPQQEELNSNQLKLNSRAANGKRSQLHNLILKEGSVSHSVSGLFAIPWTVAHQAPLPMGFSRLDYWSRLPFPSQGIFPKRDWTQFSCIAGRCFTV